MRERTTEQIIHQSTDAESLLEAFQEADDTHLLDSLKPELWREVEQINRVHSLGSRGLGGFSL